MNTTTHASAYRGKLLPEHFAVIRDTITAFLDRADKMILVGRYESGQIPRADCVKDLQRRFCFDVMHASGLTPFVCREVYPYANDDHLFTALKAVCPTVTRKF